MQLHLRSIVELQPDPALYDNVIVNGLRSMHAGTVGFEQLCQPRQMLKLLAVRLDRVEAFPEHHRRGRAMDQTGRAPCRARVCQDVYLSVVAVSLNKTNKISHK